MDGGDDFCFRDRFAAANDAPPCGIALDELVLMLNGGNVEIFRCMTNGVEIWVLGQGNSCVAKALDHIFRDGRGAGDAGRLDARCLEQAVLQFGLTNEEIVCIGDNGAAASELSNR